VAELPPREVALVRELARQVADHAHSAEMEAARQRWRRVNALQRPDRAPVWCRPVGAWAELLPDAALECEEPWLRSLERRFHQALIKRDIGDDEPLDPWLPVGAVWDCEPPNRWGVEIARHHSGAQGGAWAYDPPLKTESHFGRLASPRFSLHRQRTDDALDRAHHLLGHVLPPRLVCSPPLGAILCTDAAALRGLTQLMLDMATAPHLVHRLMAHLRDATLAGIDAAESTGLLTPNHTGPMTCSQPLGTPDARGRHTAANCWLMLNSQEFDPVSPAMWEEFLLDYQRPIMARYGLVGYGCCEGLTQKIDGVLSIPNLRIFVASAWTDLDAVVDRCGSDYVIMWRQKATDVVFAQDTAALRRDLEEGLRRLEGCHVQIVLRELQTLAGHPRRLHEWTRHAKDAAAKFA